jgi:hypothetical protein
LPQRELRNRSLCPKILAAIAALLQSCKIAVGFVVSVCNPEPMTSSYSAAAIAAQFHFVSERSDDFLSLFQHRFDFIFAEHPQPGDRPNWKSENRYPLSDRLLQEGASLYGVRFGATTQYCLLDVDIDSHYHPQYDAFAISRMLGALESLGLVSSIACTSSYSGGIHLYLPFQSPHATWEVAIAISVLLENAGFQFTPGQLEVFPNPKSYVSEGTPSLFNAHRLPMQVGSYLLNQDFQPIWGNQSTFALQWRSIQQQNDLNGAVLKRLARHSRQRSYRVSGKADQFIHDLNAEIELGWTAFGQTNRILGRITMRSYIFHHVLFGGEPLVGQALVDEITAVARSLPGYGQWCRHQHEIEKKSAEWARCIENSAYFPYGTERGKFKAKSELIPDSQAEPDRLAPSWNQQQTEAARERIKGAIADLLEKDSLPMGATARFRVLTSYGIGGGSLYRHRDLWHPDHLWKTPPIPPSLLEDERIDCAEGASIRHSPTSFLSEQGGNTCLNEQSSDFGSVGSLAIGGNPAPALAFGRLEEMEQAALLEAKPIASPQEPVEMISVASAMLLIGGFSPLQTSFYDCWHDLSDLLAAVSVEIRRLAWTSAVVRDRLLSCFGRSHLALLEDWEVAQWLIWLRQQHSSASEVRDLK